MTIPTRLSGPTGIAISAIGLGSWSTWDRADHDTVVETLTIALDAGANYFDVGIYGNHLAEPDPNGTEMRFAAAMSDIGVPRDGWVFAAKGWLPEPRRPEVAPLIRQIDALCQRQRTDHADILVLGDLMEPRADYSDILGEVSAILAAGKARAWAVNNWAASEVAAITEQAEAMGTQGPDFAQHKYGLIRRAVPEGAPYRDLCERTGLRIQASDTFDGGLIFGPRAAGEVRYIGGDVGGIHAQVAAATGRIREAAAALGATPAQLAIAVPLSNPHTANVLLGSRTPEQTRDNLGVFDLLQRHSAAEILAVADEFWLDRGAVSPDSGWGTAPDADPDTYRVLER